MELKKEAQEWLAKRGMWPEQMSSRINVGAQSPSPEFSEIFAEYHAHILSKQSPSPGLSVDEVMDAMDHVGHMPDNSDHIYLWEEKFRARLNELIKSKK